MNKANLAYVVGLAIGDGNLSNPNGRAVRLRITCDLTYPKLITKIITAIKKVAPNNQVSIIKSWKGTYIDISCYSNKWEKLLGWKAKRGPKYNQKVTVPNWIKNNKIYTKFCLRGLFQTDGSIYYDRGYLMANFTTTIATLAKDVIGLLKKLNFTPHIYILNRKIGKKKFTIRISKKVKKFIKTIGCIKD